MAEVGETSSPPTSSPTQRPLVLRVKRKPSQSPVEAFWLEISERPLKRALHDFENLSLAASSGKEESRTKRVFVKHVETVSSSENTIDALQSFVVQTGSENGSTIRPSSRGRHSLRKENKQGLQGQLLSKAKQEHEALAKSARFEQIWRSRRGNKDVVHDEGLHEVCRLYDVVRVDAEETPEKSSKQETMSKEDQASLCKFLPMLRELVPDAAEDIESDMNSNVCEQDGFVYDLYAVEDNAEEMDVSYPFPLVQVDDDDDQWDDGPDDSDYETEDSNAENHPVNDYPDEEESDEEDESKTSTDESEEEKETGSEESTADEHPKHLVMSDDDIDDDYDDGNMGDLRHAFGDDDADTEDL